MVPRIALIGCGGFIGHHLLRRLLDAGYAVEGWDLDTRRLDDLRAHPGLTFHQADYSSAESLAGLAKHRIVIQLAALCNPSLYNTEDLRVIESNFTRPLQLAQALARSKTWLIYFSTSEVYGRTVSAAGAALGLAPPPDRDGADLLREDSTPLLLGPVGARRWSYACAKQLMERALVGLQASENLAWTVVRPFNFLGPGMDFIPGVDGEGIPRVLACFMDALLHGRPLQLVEGGNARRCFTWIGDAVDAVLAILEHPDAARNQCFNIGNPHSEVSMAELAVRLHATYNKMTGATRPLWAEAISAEFFYGPGYEDSDRRLPDVSKAKRLLGWEARTDLASTLQTTVAWYVKHYSTPTL